MKIVSNYKINSNVYNYSNYRPASRVSFNGVVKPIEIKKQSSFLKKIISKLASLFQYKNIVEGRFTTKAFPNSSISKIQEETKIINSVANSYKETENIFDTNVEEIKESAQPAKSLMVATKEEPAISRVERKDATVQSPISEIDNEQEIINKMINSAKNEEDKELIKYYTTTTDSFLPAHNANFYFNLNQKKICEDLKEYPEVLEYIYLKQGKDGKLPAHHIRSIYVQHLANSPIVYQDDLTSIHNVFKNKPEVLIKMHTTKDNSGCLPVHCNPDSIPYVIEIFKDRPDIIEKILLSEQEHSYSEDCFASLPLFNPNISDENFKISLDLLKDKPDLLVKIFTTKDKEGRVFAHYELTSDRIKKVHDVFKDQPEVIKQILLTRDKEGLYPSQLSAHYSLWPKSIIFDEIKRALKDSPKILEEVMTTLTKNEYAYILYKTKRATFEHSFLECLKELHAIPDKDFVREAHLTPYNGNVRRLLIHRVRKAETFAEIHNYFKNSPDVLQRLHLTKDGRDRLPAHYILEPQAHRELARVLGQDILEKIYLTRDYEGRLPAHNIYSLIQIHENLKNSPKTLMKMHTIADNRNRLIIHEDNLLRHHKAISDIIKIFENNPTFLKQLLSTPYPYGANKGKKPIKVLFKDNPELLEQQPQFIKDLYNEK